jgi:hypothetical protein
VSAACASRQHPDGSCITDINARYTVVRAPSGRNPSLNEMFIINRIETCR